ncbi:mediator of RNA polymerase II transcription subunit 27 [Cimex lectularius]|uniref:Mediator of RNA polymerase II transcription subunit 27 n=1 Tax=Cimex lectularius TaxID=79782 RepID=A0A8I6RFE8_CIMLE|nr:mediator of RNA polymerase II transcription subunit 27 [Cimex lectularius]
MDLAGRDMHPKMMDNLYTALSSIKVLRCTVGQIFSALANGVRADHFSGEENKEAKFVAEIDDLLNAISQQLREVDQAVANLQQPTGPFTLGNTSFLSQECTLERQGLYGRLVLSYKWTDKIHEYSAQAATLLSQNSLKRTYYSGSTKRRRPLSSHNVPPQNVDSLLSAIDRQYSDMNFSISRPFASNAVVQIQLGRVLQAAVAFKGLMIEWVVVKATGETIDLWTESRHKVFRKITENCHAAMLHFSSPTLPEIAVRSFMTWFHSHITLFSDTCKRCGNHLHCALPPTWRDFRSLEPFHEECKS